MAKFQAMWGDALWLLGASVMRVKQGIAGWPQLAEDRTPKTKEAFTWLPGV